VSGREGTPCGATVSKGIAPTRETIIDSRSALRRWSNCIEVKQMAGLAMRRRLFCRSTPARRVHFQPLNLCRRQSAFR